MRGKLESVNKKMHMIRYKKMHMIRFPANADISDCAVHIFCSVEKCKIDQFEKGRKFRQLHNGFIFIHESKISRNRKCNNQLYDFLGTILELDEDYIC